MEKNKDFNKKIIKYNKVFSGENKVLRNKKSQKKTNEKKKIKKKKKILEKKIFEKKTLYSKNNNSFLKKVKLENST